MQSPANPVRDCLPAHFAAPSPCPAVNDTTPVAPSPGPRIDSLPRSKSEITVGDNGGRVALLFRHIFVVLFSFGPHPDRSRCWVFPSSGVVLPAWVAPAKSSPRPSAELRTRGGKPLYMTTPELLAIRGHSSAASLPTGPVMAEPFISPLGLTICMCRLASVARTGASPVRHGHFTYHAGVVLEVQEDTVEALPGL